MKVGRGVNTKGGIVKLQKFLFQTLKNCKVGIQIDKFIIQMITFQFLFIYLEITFHLLIFVSMNGNSIFPVFLAFKAGPKFEILTCL